MQGTPDEVCSVASFRVAFKGKAPKFKLEDPAPKKILLRRGAEKNKYFFHFAPQ